MCLNRLLGCNPLSVTRGNFFTITDFRVHGRDFLVSLGNRNFSRLCFLIDLANLRSQLLKLLVNASQLLSQSTPIRHCNLRSQLL